MVNTINFVREIMTETVVGVILIVGNETEVEAGTEIVTKAETGAKRGTEKMEAEVDTEKVTDISSDANHI